MQIIFQEFLYITFTYWTFKFCYISGEFILTKPNIQMKPAFKQYSVNESYSPSWDRRIKEFIDKKKTSGDEPIPQR